MPLVSSEFKFYRSGTINETGTNGGRLSSTEIATAVLQTLFPNVTDLQRASGLTQYRKLFCKIANADNLAGNNPRLWLKSGTPGDSSVVAFLGTQRNTQSDITTTPPSRVYGAGVLVANVSAGATSLQVDVDPGTPTSVFQNSDVIHIETDANDEFATLASSSAVSWSGNRATLTLAAGLLNSWTAAAPTRIGAVMAPSTVQCSVDNWVETGAGTFDEVGHPVVCDNIGTIEQTWTLTFTSATAFGVVGDTVGSVGTGSVSSDFAPTNPAFSRAYFTLPSAGFGGTWAAGNTIVFQTHPAAVPVWIKWVVPVGAASIDIDNWKFTFTAESG